MRLATRDVEEVVARVFDVPATDKLALRARLENLRKKGWPHGLTTGRGRVAKFDFDQLSDLSVALALIDAGLSPEHAVLALEDADQLVRDCFSALAHHTISADELSAAFELGNWPMERTVIAWCFMHRLLSRQSDPGVPVATWTITENKDGPRTTGINLSAVRVDLGSLFLRLVRAVSQVTQVEVDELTITLRERMSKNLVSS